MKIAVAGTGYVGLSNAIILAQRNKVYAVDVVQSKVDLINSKKSPIVDKEIEDYLANKKLDLTATTDGDLAYKDVELVVIAMIQSRTSLILHQLNLLLSKLKGLIQMLG